MWYAPYFFKKTLVNFIEICPRIKSFVDYLECDTSSSVAILDSGKANMPRASKNVIQDKEEVEKKKTSKVAKQRKNKASNKKATIARLFQF